jgi:hypothetical protein
VDLCLDLAQEAAQVSFSENILTLNQHYIMVAAG